MPTRWPDPPKPGDPLKADWGVRVVDVLKSLGIALQYPLVLKNHGRRAQLTIDVDGLSVTPAVRWVKTAAITARTTGTVYPYGNIRTGSLTGGTTTVYNAWPDDIGSGRLAAVIGDVIVWSCNAAP